MPGRRGVNRRGLLKGTLAGAGALGLGVPARALARAAPPPMPTAVFGRTGERIPRLVLGTAAPITATLLKRAVDLGVTYFDLADCYVGGKSEQVAGQFLQKTGLRKKIWLTTKSDEHDPDGLEKTLAGSLGRIQVDQVDLLFLHNLSDPARLSKDLKARVEKLKREGKIRFFGFSTHAANVVDTLNLAARLGWVDAIMFKYNFRSYGDRPLNQAIDVCKKASIGLIAMKTQASHFSFADRLPPFEAKGYSKAQAVLKAVWQDDRIDAIVSEMKNFEQLEQNVAAARDVTRLGALDVERLREYAEATRSLYCQGCEQHCRPALERPVRVADTLRLLMYHDEYGEPERARRLFRDIPPTERDLAGLDLAAAARACPHGLDLAALLGRAARVLG